MGKIDAFFAILYIYAQNPVTMYTYGRVVSALPIYSLLIRDTAVHGFGRIAL